MANRLTQDYNAAIDAFIHNSPDQNRERQKLLYTWILTAFQAPVFLCPQAPRTPPYHVRCSRSRSLRI